MKRYKMKKRTSKKLFTRAASRTHKRNLFNASSRIMRGGYRI